jgi:hydrogenase maturation protease
VKILVAGVGNIFFGDDGFGSEVVRVLVADPIPDVKIEDYGIRGLHLAYEVVAGYDRVFFIDAVPRGQPPGTLYVIEPKTSGASATADAHGMDLETVFAFVRTLGGELPPLTLVGCEPWSADPEIGLTEPVRNAVQPAANLIRRLVAEAQAASSCGKKEERLWLEA